jgi:hypothetical protein
MLGYGVCGGNHLRITKGSKKYVLLGSHTDELTRLFRLRFKAAMGIKSKEDRWKRGEVCIREMLEEFFCPGVLLEHRLRSI